MGGGCDCSSGICLCVSCAAAIFPLFAGWGQQCRLPTVSANVLPWFVGIASVLRVARPTSAVGNHGGMWKQLVKYISLVPHRTHLRQVLFAITLA